MHLTNASVQKKHAGYAAANADADGDDAERADGGGRANIWSLAQLGAYLARRGTVPSGPAFVARLRAQMKEASATVLAAAAPKLDRKRGFFDLLGPSRFRGTPAPDLQRKRRVAQLQLRPEISL